jgi:hypothetical protein
MKFGDLVVMPFAYSDGTCCFCHEGIHTSCIRAGSSARAVTSVARRPKRFVSPKRTERLVGLPVGEDDALMRRCSRLRT